MRNPNATWLGDKITNKTKGSMYGHKGLVVHADGVDNIDADNNWFHNPKAQVSAHFGIRNDGELVQWVDTDDTAWAEVAGNHYWVSVEEESKGEPLTQAQVETTAKLFAWLHKIYGFPLVVTSDVDGTGLGHHSMGGAEWGGHFMCPGNAIIDQKPEIAHRARLLNDMPNENAGHPHPVQHPATPAVEVKVEPTPKWFKHELRYVHGEKFMHGPDVKTVQRKVKVPVDGLYGEQTAARVRGFQMLHKLKADGIVGPATARELGA